VLAALWVGCLSVLAFWWLQWSGAGPIGPGNEAAASIGKHDRDDD